MDIHFRTIKNTSDEILMGHKIWFHPCPDCDSVSATANAFGFSPLISAARHFYWDYDKLTVATEACNRKQEVAVLTETKPLLFLVPTTKGSGDSRFLISDLLRAASKLGVRRLHFTHFSFLQGRFPEREILDILEKILDANDSHALQKLVFDIDERATNKLYSLMRPRA